MRFVVSQMNERMVVILLAVDVIQELTLDVFVVEFTGKISRSCLAVSVTDAAGSNHYRSRAKNSE